jgi:hypothetical protein
LSYQDLSFEVLRKDEEFVLYRGRSKDDSFQVLVLSPVAEYPSPESLKRLDHEYSLRENLDARWTALPRARLSSESAEPWLHRV